MQMVSITKNYEYSVLCHLYILYPTLFAFFFLLILLFCTQHALSPAGQIIV